MCVDCNEKLRSALFLVVEISVNDYNYALFQGKTIQEAKHMVPNVVRTIKSVVEVMLILSNTVIQIIYIPYMNEMIISYRTTR